MKEPVENKKPASTPTLCLESNWSTVTSAMGDVVECLERESIFATGHLKTRLQDLVEFLGQEPSCDEVLANADALVMLLPLLGHPQHGKELLPEAMVESAPMPSSPKLSSPKRSSPKLSSPIPPLAVESVVRYGVGRIDRRAVYRRNWLQLFWYPASVALVALAICIFLSIKVAPQFEIAITEFVKGFDEMEIDDPYQLPMLTQIVFSAGAFLRSYGLLMLIVAGVAAWWLRRANMQGRRGPAKLGWWDDRTISVRGAVAVWADHMASLLHAGVDQTDAFTIASGQAPKRNLRRLSAVIARRDQALNPDDDRQYFPLKKYAMVDYALSENFLPAKIEALEEVAFYYRNRDQLVSVWWISWVSTGLLWLMGLLVLVMFLAVLMPLHDLGQFLTSLFRFGGN